MALAIDISDGRGLSNEARLSKKSKITLYLPFILQQKPLTLLIIWSASVLKVDVPHTLQNLQRQTGL